METTVKSNQRAFLKDSILEKFFIDSLKDIYWAENRITKALPKMQEAANSPRLEQAFQEHLDVTYKQISRLEEAFQIMGQEAEGKKCEAMKGLIDEAETIIDETEDGTATRDVGLILAAQKVEHYEIATYGGLAQLAKTLGQDSVAKLLEDTLKEEYEADHMLTNIAENDINYQASEESES